MTTIIDDATESLILQQLLHDPIRIDELKSIALNLAFNHTMDVKEYIRLAQVAIAVFGGKSLAKILITEGVLEAFRIPQMPTTCMAVDRIESIDETYRHKTQAILSWSKTVSNVQLPPAPPSPSHTELSPSPTAENNIPLQANTSRLGSDTRRHRDHESTPQSARTRGISSPNITKVAPIVATRSTSTRQPPLITAVKRSLSGSRVQSTPRPRQSSESATNDAEVFAIMGDSSDVTDNSIAPPTLPYLKHEFVTRRLPAPEDTILIEDTESDPEQYMQPTPPTPDRTVVSRNPQKKRKTPNILRCLEPGPRNKTPRKRKTAPGNKKKPFLATKMPQPPLPPKLQARSPILFPLKAPVLSTKNSSSGKNRGSSSPSRVGPSLAMMMDTMDRPTDHHLYAVRDAAYSVVTYNLPFLQKPPDYVRHQTVFCLDAPGLRWVKARVTRIEKQLIYLQFQRRGNDQPKPDLITNKHNPYVRVCRPDTIRDCVAGEYLLVNGDPVQITAFDAKKGLLFVKYNNGKQIQIPRVHFDGSKKSRNSDVDFTAVQILPCYGIRDRAYALDFSFTKPAKTTEFRSVPPKLKFTSNELVEVFDFGKDGAGQWELAHIADMCFQTGAVLIQYANYSPYWSIWTKSDSPHIRKFMPRTPSPQAAGKQLSRQDFLQLSSGEQMRYLAQAYPKGKHILARWSPRDPMFYRAIVLEVRNKNCIKVRFPGDDVVKDIFRLETWTKAYPTEEELKHSDIEADKLLWDGKDHVPLYPYKDESSQDDSESVQ